MDKSSQNNLYAGLLIYRLQRNVEYLLLNDSFTNKKHWFCPKGQVIGQEDEVKCALRETFEATGLSPKDLRVEEGFKIELKYLSGTRPKKVVYRLAQILDNHARLLPNADGVHFQWCNQTVATEKVIFKSMEDVFKYAQQFIENKLKARQHNRRNRENNAGDSMDHRQRNHHHSHHRQQQQQQHGPAAMRNGSSPQVNGMVTHHQNHHHSQQQSSPSSQHHQQQQQRRQNQQNESAAAMNPLYKTRLCERFEKEGTCSYGSKCTFAHGIAELRERAPEEEQQQHHNGGISSNGNSQNVSSLSPSPGNASASAGTTAASVGSTKPAASSSSNAESNPLYKTKLCDRFMKDNFCQYGPKCHFAHGSQELKERPVFNNNNNNSNSENVTNSTTTNKSIEKLGVTEERNSNNSPLQEVMNGRISPTNKSWMKVVHLSKEEQAKLEMSPPAKTPSPTPAKAAQEEAIIGDLKRFFAEHSASQATSNGKLTDDVKEVTKLEMRNDLSKRQLLYILLASLLEDSPAAVGATLKTRISLFKTFVKTMTDQRTLLKAWEKFVTNRSPALLSKTVMAFSTWYDCDLVDEEAFLIWYDVLPDGSDLKIKSTKFIEWLSTADEDDDE
ncbi:hypothetical protein BDB00DRAFT_786111 [Zychaea mexicana]|uniref:uncharacterized protein n=1 Tax=Zychaea mexicana TaxID=64656 RepID=UPI0022FEE39B|nr:uncharacterized protein BDB00DRAFT_786111 [Zychaea mexicana]KAI9495893.1 hypothetical protein BDB00DRAFT_786111 [Zychaea mexicana]